MYVRRRASMAVNMSTLAIDIQNLPTLDEIEKLIISKRQEMAELRKLKSLARLREKSTQPGAPKCRDEPPRGGEREG